MKVHSILTLTVAGALATTPAYAVVTASNLLAYYNMNGQIDNQFGPAPGAALGGAAAFSSGNLGFSGAAGDESLDLFTVNDGSYAQTSTGAHFDSLTANNAFSVSFWQYNTAVGNTSAFWLHAPDANGNMRGAQAHTPWGNGTIFFDQSGCCNGAQRLTVDGLVQTDQWQHFVFQRDAAGLREIWVDGVLAASAEGGEAVDPFDGQFTIGSEGPSQANSFGGRIDEMAVWNTTLTPDEIGTLAGGAITTAIIPEPSGILFGLLGLFTLGLRRHR